MQRDDNTSHDLLG